MGLVLSICLIGLFVASPPSSSEITSANLEKPEKSREQLVAQGLNKKADKLENKAEVFFQDIKDLERELTNRKREEVPQYNRYLAPLERKPEKFEEKNLFDPGDIAREMDDF